MAKGKRSGSLIYEILIGLLVIGIILSLFIPKQIWKSEAEYEEKCQSNLTNIWTLETYYKQKTNSYTSSIESLVSVLRSDPEIMALVDTSYSMQYIAEDESLTVIYNMPIDSILACPHTGLPYVITLADSGTPVITIECPNEEMTKRKFGVFEEKIISHGSIKDGEPSWD
ncbi:type II secretion system protein [candidate division KSB1 bacterium]